jgi:uncharacterized cofD-like protein
MKKIVAIGGGTGLFTLLSGLKKYTNEISAIVTMADEGGSTGRLRAEIGVLPPGDVRMCLVALSNEKKLLSDLFQYRFDNGGLKGHSFGNLFLSALEKVTGNFEDAIEEAGQVLKITGKVIPSTVQKARLCAKLENAKTIIGEPNIGHFKMHHDAEIKNLYYEPKKIKPTKSAIFAIKNADIIVFGPGSLYTSIIPNILVFGIRDAIKKSKAKKVFVVNVMTQHGETDDFSASKFYSELEKYLGKNVIDYVVVNTGKVPKNLLQKYCDEWKEPVIADIQKIKRVKIIAKDIIKKKDFARHDEDKVAKAIISI